MWSCGWTASLAVLSVAVSLCIGFARKDGPALGEARRAAPPRRELLAPRFVALALLVSIVVLRAWSIRSQGHLYSLDTVLVRPRLLSVAVRTLEEPGR